MEQTINNNAPKEKEQLSKSQQDSVQEEYEIVEFEIFPEKIVCPDCGGITLEGLDFCDQCGGELYIQ